MNVRQYDPGCTGNSRLPTFSNNPALMWFPVSNDGLSDAGDTKLLWNYEDLDGPESLIGSASRIKDVSVFHYPKHLVKDPKHPIVALLDRIDDLYECVDGNTYSDRESGDIPAALLEIWEHMRDTGFLNDAEAYRAWQEFARIREFGFLREADFKPPSGSPWTDAEREALEHARNKWKAQVEEIKRNPPPPMECLHPDEWVGRDCEAEAAARKAKEAQKQNSSKVEFKDREL